MALSQKIPLIRASFLEPFYLLAKEIGTPVDSVLRSVHLPTQSLEDKNLLLAEIPCWNFLEAVAKKEAYFQFGLLAGDKIPWTELSTMQPLFKGCDSLYELLKRFIHFAPLQSKTCKFSLIEERDVVWLVDQSAQIVLVKNSFQRELSTLMGMIQLVQAVVGKDWRPSEIHLLMPTRLEITYAEQLNPSRIIFSQTNIRIAIPRYLLPLPLLTNQGCNHDGIIDMHAYTPIPDSYVEQIIASIIPYLGSKDLNKKLVADIAGVSARTLNRRLELEGASYLGAIDQARLIHSKTLLKTPDLTLMDISLMLGYQNASSFSRAFRRWVGLSPREFQLLAKNNDLTV